MTLTPDQRRRADEAIARRREAVEIEVETSRERWADYELIEGPHGRYVRRRQPEKRNPTASPSQPRPRAARRVPMSDTQAAQRHPITLGGTPTDESRMQAAVVQAARRRDELGAIARDVLRADVLLTPGRIRRFGSVERVIELAQRVALLGGAR